MGKIPSGLNKLCNILDGMVDQDLQECIVFKYRLNDQGYSRPKLSTGKQVFAHRFSYCWENGVSYDSIEGLCIMHSCDNPSCINPNHLSAGTWADNNKDRASKNRAVVSTTRRKLSKEDVEEIKRRYDPTKKRDKVNGIYALAREYGVDGNVIYKALRGGYDDWSPTKAC